MRIYVITFLVFVFCLSLSVAGFNYRADPYGIYSFPDITAEKLSRLNQFFVLRVSKPWFLDKLKPEAIIVGSSRTVQIIPSTPSWDGMRSFNAALPGMTIFELKGYVEHFVASGSAKKLLIGFDINALLSPEPKYRFGFNEERLASPDTSTLPFALYLQRGRDSFNTLLSFSATSDSLSALTNKAEPGILYSPDGSWRHTKHEFVGAAAYRIMFQQFSGSLETDVVSYGSNLEAIRDVLKICYEHNIDARIFFTPTHTIYVDLWEQKGKKDMWLNAHRKLILLNEEIAAELHKKPFPIWAFGNEKGVVDEPISEHAAKWFSDGVHYDYRLGKMIMNSIWEEKPGFGMQLNSGNSDAYLQETIAIAKTFREQNMAFAGKLYSNTK